MSCKQQKSSTALLPSDINYERAVASFRSHRDTLAILLRRDLPKFANCLYAKSLITESALEEAMNPTLSGSLRVVSLLSVVEDRIRAKPHTFTEFVGILESEPTLKSLATELIDKYNGSSVGPKAEYAHSPAISRYGDYLKGVYNATSISNDGKFPPTPSKKYINLALVKNEGEVQTLNQLMKCTLHGKVDDMLEFNKQIEVCDILKKRDNGRPVSLVFIEGPPGIGKSTLAWELCRRWDRKQYDLAVLLRLREREVQEMKNVADLFQHDSKELQLAVAEEVVDREGKGVLFILDGYDELPPSKEQSGKNLLNRLLTSKSLPKCTVVVTSRPSATHKLHEICRPNIDRHLEILGFTQNCVKEYASSVLSSTPKILKGFLSYVSASENPAINSLMYIPLNAAIVVEIYRNSKETGTSIPITLTQLYKQLCLIILQRYLRNVGNDTVVTQFSDLPKSVYEHFQKLSEVAYETFKKHEIIFYSESVPKDFINFGFLDSVTSLYSGSGISYNFLHLTLHEFFTAYYISNFASESEDFSHYYNDSRWNVVWKFVSGLTSFQFFKNAEKTDAFVISNSTEENLEVKIFLMQCLFEAQIDFDYKFIYQNEHILIKWGRHCFPLDLYATGYCIVNTSSPVSWSVQTRGLSDDHESFTWGLKSNPTKSGNVRCITTASINPCFELYPISVLQGIHKLQLINQLLPYDGTFLSALKVLPQMTNLKFLTLGISLPTKSLLELFYKLPNSSVTNLEVQFDDDVHGGVSHFQDIRSCLANLIKSQHCKITCLCIRPQRKNFQYMKHFCKNFFEVSPSLKLFSITLQQTLSDGCLSVLQINTCLASLHILCGARNYLPILASILHQNKTLKILTWGKIDRHSHNDVQLFNNALSHNVTLKFLILWIKKYDTLTDCFVLNHRLVINYYTQESEFALCNISLY